MTIKPLCVILCVASLAAWARTVPAEACPSCKVAVQQAPGDSAGGDGPGGNPARGYYLSILAMLGMLSLVAGGLIRLMVQAGRQVPAIPPESNAPEMASGPQHTPSDEHAE